MRTTQETLRSAVEFIAWYREMVIKGEIKISDAALACKPGNEYITRRELDMLVEGRR